MEMPWIIANTAGQMQDICKHHSAGLRQPLAQKSQEQKSCTSLGSHENINNPIPDIISRGLHI